MSTEANPPNCFWVSQRESIPSPASTMEDDCGQTWTQITGLHAARVVTSKCQKDSAVQYGDINMLKTSTSVS